MTKGSSTVRVWAVKLRNFRNLHAALSTTAWYSKMWSDAEGSRSVKIPFAWGLNVGGGLTGANLHADVYPEGM